MASAPKRGKFIYEHVYEEDDMVDDIFFSKLAKHIALTKLDSLRKYLDLPEAKFDLLLDLTRESSVQQVSSTKCFENFKLFKLFHQICDSNFQHPTANWY